VRRALLLLLLAGCGAAPAAAHPLAPALLELVEVGPERYAVHWKLSRRQAPGRAPSVALPAHCAPAAQPSTTLAPDSVSERWQVRCPGGLTGSRIAVRGLAASRIDVLLVAELARAGSHRTVLRAGAPSWRVPARASRLDVLRGYGSLGVAHVAFGLDHALFLVGLALLVAGGRALIGAVTAFTLGHSLTLALAATGALRLPQGPVELLIAASVLWLACELAAGDRGGWLRRWPAPLAAGFGLLHGLGFASALLDAGLPAADLPLSLLSFNAGIELGQLGWLAAALGLCAAWRSWPSAPAWLASAPVHGMGVVAGWLCVGRAWELAL
jgi:hypothetical protein